jgi:2'-5' RNA ligase
MSDLLRTFIALKINPEPPLLLKLKELKNELAGEPVKWVDENNLHLTLKFLGDTTLHQVDDLKAILKKISARSNVFSFRLKGLAFFKNKGIPRVLFIGIEEGEALQQLAAEINLQLFALGFEKENRPFSPHLTLARLKFLKDKRNFYNAIDKYRDTDIQSIVIHEIILYQSILKPAGPIYKPLEIFRLEG